METLQSLLRALPEVPETLLAGVSGGADSVALLRLLVLRGCRVTAVHVNHGLRGAESDADEDFVRGLCATLGVPLRTVRLQPPDSPGEDWARQARYRAFRDVAADTGCAVIALAHHRDDQAETLLLHLLRGAGLTGLSGMAADTRRDGLRILRPLLGLSRAQLRQALLSAGQAWREDASNADPRYLRNAVRGELLPLMERLSPGAGARIAYAAALLREEEDALEGRAEGLLRAHGGNDWVCIAPLMDCPPALRSRVLRLLWRRCAGAGREERSLSREQTGALTGLLEKGAGARCNLPGGWHGVRGWRCVHLVGPDTESTMENTPVPVTPEGAALGGVHLRVLRGGAGHGGAGCGDGRLTQAVPAAWLPGCVVRHRLPGDWLRPFGSGHRQSLNDYLAAHRVDGPFRGRVPLLCRGDEVLLVCGVGAGDVPRLPGDGAADDDTVTLLWSGDMPWTRET